MKQNTFLKSFEYAINGLRTAFSERNFRLHIISTFLVIALGLFLNITKIEWVLILLCIGMVVSMELINTAIEEIVDFVSPGRHEKAGKIKDLAAAAVLIVSIVAFIIAIIIFIPYLPI
ncbi:MAG: diacylglycerol kinase family protein [bacterium]|nr:diacylglycerol kinase family protein [bacterium]